jgi:hypothetical protein
MKTLSRDIVVKETVFITNDGKEFKSESSARSHEAVLDGSRKTCSACRGIGKVNERYENEWQSGIIPTSGEYVIVHKSDSCKECGGKGYLERCWR